MRRREEKEVRASEVTRENGTSPLVLLRSDYNRRVLELSNLLVDSVQPRLEFAWSNRRKESRRGSRRERRRESKRTSFQVSYFAVSFLGIGGVCALRESQGVDLRVVQVVAHR